MTLHSNDHDIDIRVASTDEDIRATFDVLSQLRPHLARASFDATIRQLMDAEGFRLAALTDRGRVRAVAGYRVITMLYRGRILYVDDLVTDAAARSRGYGARMLAWLRQEAGHRHCVEIQLISKLIRVDAHRFYKRHGFEVECLHLLTKVEQPA